MINILIFGDSNSWGYVDDGTGMPLPSRWPIIFSNSLNELGIQNHVKEDCLPGRTTNIDDGTDGKHLNGSRIFKSSLLSHSPLDLAIIMLGTNDLKARFHRTVKDIAKGIEDLINISQHTYSSGLSWHDEKTTPLLIIAPPPLGSKCSDPNWHNYNEWINAFDTSQEIFLSYQEICNKKQIPIINSNDFIQSSDEDPIHWSAESHAIFGRNLALELPKKIKL